MALYLSSLIQGVDLSFLNAKRFGIAGNLSVDDTAALQSLITFASANNRQIYIPAGTYKITAPLIKPQSFTGLSIVAEPGTVFDYSTIANGASCIEIIGGSGQLCLNKIEGITFKGNATSIAVTIDGQCGQLIERCTFQQNAVGVRYWNRTAGSFTEWSTATNCSWETSCAMVAEYKVTGGNNSFHGSGLVGVNYINTNGPTVVSIGDGALPYNAPLNAQIWFHGNTTVIQNNNTGALYPYFNGLLTFEHFSGMATLGAGRITYFAGTVESFGDYVEMGTFYRCKGVTVNKNNTTVAHGVEWNTAQLLGAGSTTISKVIVSAGLLSLQIVGANYDKEFLLYINPKNPFGGAGTVLPLGGTNNFDSVGYATVTFTASSTGNLIITSSNFPSSGAGQLTAHISYTQLANFPQGNYNQNNY